MSSRFRALKYATLALRNNFKITSFSSLNTVNYQHKMPLMGQQVRKFASVNDVKQSEAEKLFYMDLNGDRAFILYSKRNNVMTLKETFVPIELRGGGYAKILAEKAFQYIEDNNLKTKVECTYLWHYLENDGKKYKNLVIN